MQERELFSKRIWRDAGYVAIAVAACIASVSLDLFGAPQPLSDGILLAGTVLTWVCVWKFSDS